MTADTPLVPRRPLRLIDTTGIRKRVRDGVRIALGVAILLAALGFATETHRVCTRWHQTSPHEWSSAHHVLADLGPWPFVVLVGVVGLQWWAHRRRLIVGVVAAVGSAALAFGLLLAYALAHFLDHVDGAGPLVPIGLVGAFLLAAAQLVVEPVVAVLERRALARTDPVMPRAVVVEPGPRP
ncbi:MAG: hypothetical protein IPL61_27820 [Myxococcales bacterium]|nr:hypothetical protein [Myxococcales bacterium]